MAKTALILLPVILLSIGTAGKGCQSTQDRLSQANTTEALARLPNPELHLPAVCTAKMGRVYPKITEERVVTQKRWEFAADARDEQAAACQAYEDDYNATIVK